MLFHLTGLKDAQKVRTISMAEAILRLRQLQVLPPQDAKLDLLVAVRNGVAHAGGTELAEDLLPAFARVVNMLLADISEGQDEFWGGWWETATMAISGSASELERDVRLRIQNTKQLFESRVSKLPEKNLDRSLRSLEDEDEANTVTIDFEENWVRLNVECPACGGVVSVPLTLSSEPVGSLYTLTATIFVCRRCQLVLSGPEELDIANLPSVVDVDTSSNQAYGEVMRALLSTYHDAGNSAIVPLPKFDRKVPRITIGIPRAR